MREERHAQSLRAQGLKIGRAGLERGMDSYIQCMTEITRRAEFIQNFHTASINNFAQAVVAETVGLQLRKTLELIAKASLVAHRAVWAEVSLWFKRDWHASEILRRIEEVNSSFYPIPVKESRVYETGDIRAEWEDIPDDTFLTKARFIEAYGAIGDMMHAHFPDEDVDYQEFLANTQKWDSQIHELLGMHKITLLGSESFCLVQMNVAGAPRWTRWSRVESSESTCPDCGEQLFKSEDGLLCSTCIRGGRS